MVQLVKHLTLGFGSGHDLTVRKFESCVGLCNAEHAWDSLSLSLLLSLFLPHSHCFCLSQNKYTLFFLREGISEWAAEREREGESESERESHEGGEREKQRQRSSAVLTQCRTQTHELWDYDLSQSQMLNQLSHPINKLKKKILYPAKLSLKNET